MTDANSMKHLPAPGFVAGAATGVTLRGPTPDGNFHLTFFHDSAFPVMDTLPTVGIPPGEIGQAKIRKQGTEFETVRFNVATISMPPVAIIGLSKGLASLAATLEQQQAQQISARVDASSAPATGPQDEPK